MSRRGEDEGFTPHPGDPWHPGWRDDWEADSGLAEDVPDEPRRTRRRRRRKDRPDRSGRAAEVVEQPAEIEDPAPPEPQGKRRGLFGRRAVDEPESEARDEYFDDGARLDELGGSGRDDDLAALLAQVAEVSSPPGLDDADVADAIREEAEPPAGEPPNEGLLAALLGSDDDDALEPPPAGPPESTYPEGASSGERGGEVEEIASEEDLADWIAFIEEPGEPTEKRGLFGLSRRRGGGEEAAAPDGQTEGPGTSGTEMPVEGAGEGEVPGDREPLPTLDELFPALESEAAAEPAGGLDEPTAQLEPDAQVVEAASEPVAEGLAETPALGLEPAGEPTLELGIPVEATDEPAVGPEPAVERAVGESADSVGGPAPTLDELIARLESGPAIAEPVVGPVEQPLESRTGGVDEAGLSPEIAGSAATGSDESGRHADEPADVGSLAAADALLEDLFEPAPAEPDDVEQEAAEAATPVPMEWAGDPGELPRSWFAEVDEDVVVPPPPDPPEVDWEDSESPPTPDAGDVPEQMGTTGGPASLDATDLPGATDPDSAAPEAGASAGRDIGGAPAEEDWADWHAEAGAASAGDEPAREGRGVGVGGAIEPDETEAGSDAEAGEELAPPPPFDPDLLVERDTAGSGADEGWPEPAESLLDEAFDPMVLVERLDDRPVLPPFDHEDHAVESLAEAEDRIYAGGTIEHRDLAAEIARAGTGETELQALSAHMDGVHGGIVGFEDVEDLGTDEEYVAPPRSDLGARVVTGLVLVSLLLGSLFVGGEALAAFIGVVVLAGLVEFYATLRARGYQPLTLFGLCSGGAMLVATWFYGPVAIPAAILALVVVVFFFYALVPGRREALTNGGLTVLGVTWVTGTAAFAYPIVDSADFRSLVLALVVVTVAMDVGAYFVGRAWGSTPLAPILSPNKSIEGLAGGIVLAVVAAVLIGRFIDPFTIRIGAWLGLVAAVLAPIGDLVESMVKRSLGVKDMGSILPGHGGVLDRIDALLFVLPAAWILYTTTGLLV